jgi:EAL domain-containing protein (putative c-di-GMP-specific phosphodiesterase class I)
MFKHSLQKFGSYLLSLAAEGPPPAPVSRKGREVPTQRAQFDQRVRAVIASRPNGSTKILAGTVQLVGMNKIRHALGDGPWEAVAGKAHEITVATIRAHLSPHDAFDRRDDETYILCFADANKVDAAQKAEQIVAEIKQRLIREAPQAAARLRVGQEVCELEWVEDEADDTPLIDLLAGSLRKVREEAERAAKQWRHALVHEATLVYGPLWRPKARVVPMFRCLLDDATGKIALDRLRTLSGINALLETTSELDCVMLSQAVQAVHALVQNNGTAAVVVPVSFHTLNERQLRERFIGLCRDMPDAYRQFIIFELRAVPQSVSDTRLVEMIQQLKPLGKSVILEMPLDEQRIKHLAGVGLFGVALDVTPFAHGKMNFELYFTRYARHAKAANLSTLVHGVSTLGLADSAMKAGFDYIGGEAIAHALDAPKSAYHWGPPLNKRVA